MMNVSWDSKSVVGDDDIIDASVKEESAGRKGRKGFIIPGHHHRLQSTHHMDLRTQQYRLQKGPQIYFASQLSVAMRMTSYKTEYNKSDHSCRQLVVLRVYLLTW